MTSQRPFHWRPVLAALGLAALAALAACGGGGDGPSSGAEQAAAAGAAAPAAPPAVAGAAFASMSLDAAGTSSRTAGLAWTSVPGAVGYTVERKGPDAAWVTVATLGPADLAHVDDGLAPATTYAYRVSARGGATATAERSATTSWRAPLTTARPEATSGPADVGNVGPAGGRVASSDGAVQLVVPPGALDAAATVTVERTSNPLPTGLGDGLRIRLPQPPAQPLALVLGYDASMDAQADGLGVALQRGDGSWLSLPVTAIDKAARTLTVSIAPGFARSTAAGGPTERAVTRAATPSGEVEFHVLRYLNLYLSPREADVQPGGSRVLVPYAHTEGLPCHADPEVPCLADMVSETREIPFDNTKAGYTRRWYVFAEEGGTPALGTVTPRSGAGATYRAPATAPDPNPVTVSFVSRHDRSGRTVTLSSRLRVVEPVWTMIVGGVLDGAADIGFTFSAEAVWVREAGDAAVYRANGTQTVNVVNLVCTASPSPATVPLPPGALTIDRGVQPARYRLDTGSLWDTRIAGTCPGGGFANVPMRVPGRLVVEGTLSEDGTRIEGTAFQEGVTWSWALTNRL